MHKVKFVSVFVLLALLLSAGPGLVMAQEPMPDESVLDEGESVVLQTGESLSQEEVDHLKIMLHFYKANGMPKEADLVARMLAGKPSSAEMDQTAANKLRGYPGIIDSDDYTLAGPHHLFTSVCRHWWMFGKNEHTGWSFDVTTYEDIKIHRIDMTAQAWNSSGVEAYNVNFGFASASSVYCAPDDAPSSGRARSEVCYRYGPNWYDYYTGIADGTY